MKKSQKGFTLVELVVVIAIIGVLAAILVPSMLNYVKKSRLKTANSNAKLAYNAAAEYLADLETQGYSKDDAFDLAATKKFSTGWHFVSEGEPSSDADKTIYDVLAENGNESGGWLVCKATINGKSSFAVLWKKTSSDEMVGQYPEAIQWDYWKDHKDAVKAASSWISQG